MTLPEGKKRKYTETIKNKAAERLRKMKSEEALE